MSPDATHRRQLKRFDQPGHARFLTFSCFQCRPFLRSDRACQWLADAIVRARTIHVFHLWAYVFMPQHAHLLIFPNPDKPHMGPILDSIKVSVARRAVNWARANAPDKLRLMADNDTKGRVTYRFWQRGAGYDRNLWSPEKVWLAIDYIHLNPVEKGLCAQPDQWHWSSAPAYERTSAGPIPIDVEHLPPRPALLRCAKPCHPVDMSQFPRVPWLRAA
jgi:putative transposase